MRCIHSATLLATALLASLVGIGATPAAAATCASLVTLTLPDTTITAVEAVPAGTYTAPDGEVFTNLPGFCRVAAGVGAARAVNLSSVENSVSIARTPSAARTSKPGNR